MTGNPEVFHFIREHVRSVWALELLLLLKADDERCWTVDELVAALRASQTLVADNLATLGRAGLILQDDKGCFHYRPAAEALAQLCDELEMDYRAKPVTVIRWISAPAERLRSLADAFKFKGGDK